MGLKNSEVDFFFLFERGSRHLVLINFFFCLILVFFLIKGKFCQRKVSGEGHMTTNDPF